MKLEFRDELGKESLDLYFEIKGDKVERDITAQKAEIKWTLTLGYSKWGIESFAYGITEFRLPINIDTVEEDGIIDSTLVYVEIKFSSKSVESAFGGYVCRVYEEIQENGKWRQEEYAVFPIEIIVDEKPSTDDDKRSQICVKYAELDLTSDQKRLTLSI